MRAHDLDRQVQVLRATQGHDGYAETTNFIPEGSPIWAARRDVSDGEKAAADTVYAEVSARFTVRSTSFTRSITPKDRLKEGGLEFLIVGLKEIGRRQWLEITATARLDLTA